MSLHPPVHQSIRDTENALQACVTRRKRKLAELYNVTLAVGSHPQKPPGAAPEDAPSPTLAKFLDQNNLEQALYFNESTLPASPRYEWDFDDPSATQPKAQSLPLASRRDQSRPRQTGGCDSLAIDSHAVAKRTGSQPPQDTPSTAVDRDGETTENASAAAKPSNGLDQYDADRAKASVRQTRDTGSAQRLPPDKNVDPHSPPYSPDNEHISTATSKPQVDSAAESRSDVEHLRKNKPLARSDASHNHHRPVAGNLRQSDSRGTRGSSPRISTRVYENRPPSPSSTADPRSSDTSRAEARSTTTSPDDDTKQDQGRGLRQLKGDTSIDQDQDQVRIRQDTLNNAEAANSKRAGQPSMQSAHPAPSEAQRPYDQASNNIGSKDVAVQTSTIILRPAPDAIAPPQSLSTRSLPRHSQKRRRTGRTTYTAVLSKTKVSSKYAAMVRSLQGYAGTDNRIPSSKKDYMHLLFLRQALDSASAFRADLSTLLNSSNKTLSTTDWQSNLREKQDCTIIKRIYDLQQSNRWSLRQMKPSVEPSTPASYQDNLLAEMKWLQTDYREERKLRLCQSQQFAHWCQEWYHSDFLERASLQVRPSLAITAFATGTTQITQPDDAPAGSSHVRVDAPEISKAELTLDENASLFMTDRTTDMWTLQSSLDQSIASRLPLYEPWKKQVPGTQARDASLVYEDLRTLPIPQTSTQDSTEQPIVEEADDDDELPPEDTSCALFQPEWKPLRARVNLQWAHKPPSGQMPPGGFYENRRPSYWTPDDELQLKQFAKDFPSNWSLISERLTPRSSFVSASNRRTPWECYERLISMEGASTDLGTRQYAKQFQLQMDKIRMRWSHIVQQQLQSAQNAGQQTQVPRFPIPVRVERKPASKRFPALVDAARKVARKRESSEANRKQIHHEGSTQGQMPVRNKPEASYTPQQWSSVKHKQQQAMNVKQEQMRQQQHQQRAMMNTQRGQYPGQSNQTLYSSGIAQRMGSHARGNDMNAATQANTHLGVPLTNSSRAFSQGQNGLTNSVSAANQFAQMGVGARAQASLHGQERSTGHYNGTGQISEQNIQQLMQQAQQQAQQQARSTAQYPVQRPSSQNQFNRNSSSLAHANGASNLNMMGHMNGETAQSPRPATSATHGSNHGSPDLAHQMAAPHYGNTGSASQPQSLSTGQVPTVVRLHHQIMQQHPGMTGEEVQRMTDNELKSMLDSNRVNNTYDRSRQNAINAATGMHSNLQQQQQQAQRAQGPQSPYIHPTQSANSTVQQQQQQQQGSTYATNGMIASNPHSQQLPNPANAAAVQHNKNYAQQMRQSTSQQMARNTMASPSMGSSGMRPPSSSGGNGFTSALTIEMAHQQQQQQQNQRPGTANSASVAAQMHAQMGAPGTPKLASQSPRPVSAQGLP